MTTMRSMCKFLPKSAPLWMHEAKGFAVWCKVGGEYYEWIKPEYREGSVCPFTDIHGCSWKVADPVTDKETLDETENLR